MSLTHLTRLAGALRLVALCMAALAGEAQAADSAAKNFEDGKTLGKQLSASGTAELRTGSTANLTPQYNPNPAERSVYGGGSDFSGPLASQRAQCEAQPNDPSCSGIKTGLAPRPKMLIAPSDPALASQGAVAHPTAILGDIGSTYSTCTTGTPQVVTPATYKTEVCTQATPGWTSHVCNKSAASVSQACKQGSVIATATGTAGGVTLTATALCGDPSADTQTYTLQWLAPAGPINQTLDVQLPLDKPTPVVGKTQLVARVFVGPHTKFLETTLEVTAYGPPCNGAAKCSMNFAAQQLRKECEPAQGGKLLCSTYNDGPSVLLQLDFNRPGASLSGVPAQNECAAYEPLTPSLPADGMATPVNPVMPLQGERGQTRCVKTAATCTLSDATSKTCLNWQSTFECMDVAATSTCPTVAANGCSPSAEARCDSFDTEGRCTSASQAYQCKLTDAVYAAVTNCGANSFCSGGSCWDTTYPPNDAFALAVSQLQARMDAAKDFDANSMSVFKGAAGKCSKREFGLRDCCNDNWDLITCPADERRVAKQVRDGLCHLVGEFCARKVFLLGCERREKKYCCFGGILARTVQEQGHEQISKSWGSPQNPDCSGFTIDQFTALNWEAIDLSDWYSKINPVLPNFAASTDGAAAKGPAACYYGSGKCGH